ncbi:MAG: amidase family protein [Proteobacteria bacterium]|nr:amidase family protein [Pseudomonadota bacterium]
MSLSLSDYLGMDAIELALGVRQQQFSNADVTACAIEQAQKTNPTINAINIECFDAALAQAQHFDQHPDLLNQSRVAGLPFLIKDLATVKGLGATYGSRLYKDFVAERSYNIARKYLDAGLIVLGKTNTPECGLTLTTEPVANGITRNPWNTEHSPGGSSGGAAAAVAAGITPVAHATDGGGSIRVPAACCGLFGLKPSRGLTAIENKRAASWGGMSVGHVVSQTVRDSAAFLDLIKLEEPNQFAIPPAPASFYANLNAAPEPLRIGVQLEHPMDQPLDDECILAVQKAAQLCESLGHYVERVSYPVDYRTVVSAMALRINAYVYQTLAPRLAALKLALEDAPLEISTRIMANLGRDVDAAAYLEAVDTVKEAERTMAEFHHHHDVIVSPVISKTPARIGWLDMNSSDQKEYVSRFRAYGGFTALYNGTGQPSMSVPGHQAKNGLPVGVMFTAAWGSDLLLLQLARQLEQAQPWPRSAPVCSA